MKKFTFLLLGMLFICGISNAQNANKKWAVGIGPGADFNFSKNPTEKNSMLNLYLSRYLNPSFDIMLDTRMSFWGDNYFGGDHDEPGQSYTANGVDIVNPLLNLRYKFSNGYIFKENSFLQPYLIGGLGYMWDKDVDGLNFDAGAGMKIPLTPNISLFATTSYVKEIKSSTGNASADDHLQLTGIIEFAFGKAKDSDGDGVKDRKDECPDTPAGVQVDEKGCPLDRDGDGVPDYKDDCPDVAGPANLNGCPDRDGDGIIDKNDDCPDVPGLLKFKGCPDTDGDGVPDPKDKCPNTPKGCPVNEVGCPLDSDGDGVIDCQDRCPTEVGSVDNEGCPDWQTLQIPNILFDFDKATLRPKGKAELDKLASQLLSSKQYEIEVAGYTDSTGPEKYNMGLSERRAQSVVKYLLKKGVNNAYISSEYYGESNPAVKNDTRAHRQLNRRVEFEVAKIKK